VFLQIALNLKINWNLREKEFSGLAARPNKRQDAIAKFKQAVLPSGNYTFT